MIHTDRKEELLWMWHLEWRESWRDDAEEYETWRQELTPEEWELVESWDAVTPEEDIRTLFGPWDGVRMVTMEDYENVTVEDGSPRRPSVSPQ